MRNSNKHSCNNPSRINLVQFDSILLISAISTVTAKIIQPRPNYRRLLSSTVGEGNFKYLIIG